MMNLRISVTMLLMLGFWSCNSDDQDNCPEDFTGSLSSGEEVLVGKWQLKAIEADDAVDLTDDDTDNPSTDLFAQYRDCQRDALYTFETDRSYVYEQAQRIEDCVEDRVSDGTWQLESNNLSLVSSCSVQTTALSFTTDFSEFTFSVAFKITEADGNTLDTVVDFTYALLNEE